MYAVYLGENVPRTPVPVLLEKLRRSLSERSVVSGEIEQLLKSLGLTKRESEIYVGMVGSGWLDVNEIHRRTGAYASQLHYILEGLAEKGLLEVERGRPIVYKAAEPELVIESYKSRLEELKKKLVEIREHNSSKRVDDSGMARIVRNGSNILVNAQQLISRSTVDVLVYAPGWFAEKLGSSLEKALAAGVGVYLVTDSPPFTFLSRDDVCVRRIQYPGLLVVGDCRVGLVGRIEHGEIDAGTALHLSQPEIVDYLADGFYTRFWLPSAKLRHHALAATRKYTLHKLALDDVRAALESKIKVIARVEGVLNDTNRPVNVRGEVVSCQSSQATGRYSFTIVNDDGKHRIGGRNAYEEDVSAANIVLEFIG
ncbi:MAG: TrmB family transcriptional regulator [Candidatus Marsarchaeota archaeon]|nr:TrmB family transcriptional regulator [Candidatus Marsarchaeota archaeon]